MSKTSYIKKLRFLAIAEGISYLLFGLTIPLKRVYDIPEPNKIVGYAHGFLFIGYVILVFMVSLEKKWDFKTLFLAQVASLIPFGTFVADAKIFKKS